MTHPVSVHFSQAIRAMALVLTTLLLLLVLSCQSNEERQDSDDPALGTDSDCCVEDDPPDGSVATDAPTTPGGGDDDEATGGGPSSFGTPTGSASIPDVNWISQIFTCGADTSYPWSYTKTCGPTTVGMAISHATGESLTSSLVQRLVEDLGQSFPCGDYTTTSDLAWLLDSEGVTYEDTYLTAETLLEALRSNTPVIAPVYTQNTSTGEICFDDTPSCCYGGCGHFMLVVGVTPTEIIANDPGRGHADDGSYKSFDLDDFVRAWSEQTSGSFHGLTVGGDTDSPGCDLGGDFTITSVPGGVHIEGSATADAGVLIWSLLVDDETIPFDTQDYPGGTEESVPVITDLLFAESDLAPGEHLVHLWVSDINKCTGETPVFSASFEVPVGRLYVIDQGTTPNPDEATLTVLDWSHGGLIESIPVTDQPVAVDANEEYVLSAPDGGSIIELVPHGSEVVEYTINTGCIEAFDAVIAVDDIYVGCWDDWAEIRKLGVPDGAARGQMTATEYGRPAEILHHEGVETERLFLIGNDFIDAIDVDTMSVLWSTGDVGGVSFVGAAYDTNRERIAALANSGDMWLFDATDALAVVDVWGAVVGPTTSPGVVFDVDLDLYYVADSGTGAIHSVAASDGGTVQQVHVGAYPFEMDMSPDGGLWVTDYYEGQVTRVDLATFTVDVEVAVGSAPVDLVVVQ